MILIAIFSTVLLLYLLLLIRFWVVLQKKEEPKVETGDLPPLSLIIPVRNERENLPGLLEDLRQLSYPARWEVIIVDDHSDDTSLEYLRQHKLSNMEVLQTAPAEIGKKAALATAVRTARYGCIVQTDADCRLQTSWLRLMAEKLTAYDLVIGIVRMVPGKGFWSRFAALEFMSLQASGVAMAKTGQPVMGNAANIAYHKEIWERYSRQGRQHSSGDDVFLIQAVHQNGGSIGAQEHPRSHVFTNAPHSFASFLKQRVRWGGKTPAYTLLEGRLVAVLIAAVNFFLVTGIFIAIVTPGFWMWLVAGWLGKALADYLLLARFARLSAQQGLMKIYPVAAVFYPVYICLAVLMILTGSTEWKGRKLHPVSGQAP